jgi:hypothetical protein
MKKRHGFTKALHKIEEIVKEMGFYIIYTHNLDPFFKGDLDGKHIFIGSHLPTEEKLFNLLHLAGHSIQWNTNELLRTLGSHLYANPDNKLLKKLQTYEWQANCYALGILHKAGVATLDKWLAKKYILDMLHLTHFYKTGKKLKRITAIAKAYRFKKELKETPAPSFKPVSQIRTRNGLVVSFE